LAQWITTQKSSTRDELLIALELSRLAVHKDITNGSFMRTFGFVAFRLGDFAEAELSFNAAQALQDGFAADDNDRYGYCLSISQAKNGRRLSLSLRTWRQGVTTQMFHDLFNLKKWHFAAVALSEIITTSFPSTVPGT
jgi:hypothetical protein